MAHYRIKLTPVETFFFGGEKHYVKEGDESLVMNYFVESQPCPQQTTVLGLLRYILLLNNNLIGTRDKLKAEGAPLIGESSFDYNKENQTFGKIKSLSPLYFLHSEKAFVPAPLDFDYTLGERFGNKCLLKNDTPYIAKDGDLKLHLISLNGRIPELLYNPYTDNGIIFRAPHTGNEKAESGKERDEKFYKQTFLKMQKDWGFAVNAEIDHTFDDQPLFLTLGGEKSLFRVEIKKVNQSFVLQPDLSGYKKDRPLGIYLLSDSFAESDIMQGVSFAVNQTVSFRNLQSFVEQTDKYSSLGKKDEGLKRSTRYNLIAKGSVLYFNDEESREIAKKLLDKPHCKRIGFNQYMLIN